MPYIAIQAWPKEDSVKQALADRIAEVTCEVLGCPPQAITLSFEEVEPAVWEETVVKPVIEPRMDRVMILCGEKKY